MKKRPHVKRINVSLPNDTLQLLDKITIKGSRSEFINHAILYYAKALTLRQLKHREKEYHSSKVRKDIQIIKKWFDIEGELMDEYK